MNPYPATSRTLALAAELLDVTNRSELDEVLGRIVAAGSGDADGGLPGGAARALVGVLRGTAERTVPTLATVLGAGTAGERSAADTAARVFGLELEGASAEDRDFEVARQLVRFGRSAAARAAKAPAGPPAVIVRDAVEAAGRRFAPGLVPAAPAVRPWPAAPRPAEPPGQPVPPRPAVPPGPVERPGPVEPRVPSGPRTGPWVRNGSAVVLLGVGPAHH
jgi:hypothetical protein